MHSYVVERASARQREAPNWRRCVDVVVLAALVYIGGAAAVDGPHLRAKVRVAVAAETEFELKIGLDGVIGGCPNGNSGDASSGPGYRAGCNVPAHSDKCGFFEDATSAVPANIACPGTLLFEQAGARGTEL